MNSPAYLYGNSQRVHSIVEAVAAQLGAAITVDAVARTDGDLDEVDDEMELRIDGVTIASIQSGPYGYGLNSHGYSRPGDQGSFFMISHISGDNNSDKAIGAFAAAAIAKTLDLATQSKRAASQQG